ncbi:MAG TPA: hypothetical protein VJS69_06550 [Candidatus Krumholzibacteria bacterium]|nr:hypothetical protein [Candidatus Krumholzibacteria bacterium]
MLKIAGMAVAIVTALGIAYALIFLRDEQRRDLYQRRIEAFAGSETIGAGLIRVVIVLMLFPLFILVFIQPLKLLTFGLYFVLPKTELIQKVLTTSVWINAAVAVVCAFLLCRWLWIRIAKSPS